MAGECKVLERFHKGGKGYLGDVVLLGRMFLFLRCRGRQRGGWRFGLSLRPAAAAEKGMFVGFHVEGNGCLRGSRRIFVSLGGGGRRWRSFCSYWIGGWSSKSVTFDDLRVNVCKRLLRGLELLAALEAVVEGSLLVFEKLNLRRAGDDL